MTKTDLFLQSLQRPVTLANGATVTVRAWSLDMIEQSSADFFGFLRLFARALADGGELGVPDAALGLLSRVAQASLADPADAALLTVADLGDLAQAIFEVNRLAEVPGKLIGLLIRATEARAAAQSGSASSTS